MSSPSFELKSEVVRAGAGAGKTTLLTQRVIESARVFYQMHDRFPKTVVTTFTRKATQELRERIMAKATESGSAPLLDFASSKSQLHISTIHGVLSQLINRYGYVASIDPGYAIVGDEEMFLNSKKILRKVLFEKEGRHEILEKMDFAHLCHLLIDFSQRKYFNPQMMAHDEKSLSVLLKKELQSLAQEIIEVAQAISRQAETEAWQDYSSQMEIAAKALFEEDLKKATTQFINCIQSLKKPRRTAKTPGISDELADELKWVTAQWKRVGSGKKEDAFFDNSRWPDFIAEFSAFSELAERFHELLHEYKVSQGQLTMSDLESLSYYLVSHYPEVGERFSQEYDYWMVDEYQDTSPDQVALLSMLVGDRPQFTVGDPQQSIYIFRGARSEIFSEKEKAHTRAGFDVGLLQKNYRSQPELLEFFNDFFSDYGRQFSRMQPRDAVSIEAARKPVAFFALCPPDFENEKNEVESAELSAITQHLTQLLDGGARLEQVTLLGRTNGRLEKLAIALDRQGFPVHLHSSAGFFQRRETLDALAVLGFLSNPHDDQNLVTLLRSPWFHCDESRLIELIPLQGKAYDKKHSLWQVLLSNEPESRIIVYLSELLTFSRTCGFSLALERALDESGLFDWCRKLDGTGRRESNLWKLINKLVEEEKSPAFNINRFLDKPMQQVSVETGGNEDSDAVAALEPNRINLMTIHASKGLQFEHVLFPELHRAPRLSTAGHFVFDEETERWAISIFDEEEQSFVHSIAGVSKAQQMRQRELEEQERLLYVALTRAKRSVFLSWQQPAKNRSMASLLNWDFSAGHHQKENYSYSVQTENFSLCSYKRVESEQRPVRPRYRVSWEASGENYKKSYSVSQLLQKVHAAENLSPRRSSDQSRFGENAQLANEPQGAVSKIVPEVQGLQDGIQLHRLFEMLRYVDVEQREALVLEWGQQFPVIGEAFDFLYSLEKPPMRFLLNHGKVEWGFVYRMGPSIIEGQIDLWGECDDAVWIVDYKTGADHNREKAFEQLSLYAEAIRASGNKKPIQLAVIFPLKKKCYVRPADEMGDFLKKVRPFVEGSNETKLNV